MFNVLLSSGPELQVHGPATLTVTARMISGVSAPLQVVEGPGVAAGSPPHASGCQCRGRLGLGSLTSSSESEQRILFNLNRRPGEVRLRLGHGQKYQVSDSGRPGSRSRVTVTDSDSSLRLRHGGSRSAARASRLGRPRRWDSEFFRIVGVQSKFKLLLPTITCWAGSWPLQRLPLPLPRDMLLQESESAGKSRWVEDSEPWT
jgi:hypothetical protein